MVGINNNSAYFNPFVRGAAAKDITGAKEKEAAETAAKTGANAKPDAAKKPGANDALKQQLEDLKAKTQNKDNTGANAAPTTGAAATATPPAAEPENAVITATEPETVAAKTNPSLLDRLQELRDGFVNQLLGALGLGQLNEDGKGVDLTSLAKDGAGLATKGLDALFQGLSGLAGQGLSGSQALGISAQYSLNISVVMSAMNADGSMTQQSMNFSLAASFDYLGVATGQGNGIDSLAKLFNKDKTGAASETSGDNDWLAKMREMFSPEKTAQRILDFSLSFFQNSKMFKAQGDTPDSRSQFTDYIGAAIQKGFDQALGILGKLPDQTKNEIGQTHEIVFQGLDDFKNGRDSATNNVGNTYNNLQYFASSWELNYSSTTTYYNADEVKQLRNTGANPYAALANNSTASSGAANNAENGAKTDAVV